MVADRRDISVAEAERADAVGARRILEPLLGGAGAAPAVRLWNGVTLEFGDGRPRCTLLIHDARVLRELILTRDPLRLADAYVRGTVDVEGDFSDVLALKEHFAALRLRPSTKLALLARALALPRRAATAWPDACGRRWEAGSTLLKRSRRRDGQAIAFHYDVSNDFYRLWLDEQMVYSCAYFEQPDESLERAQRNKLDLLCRKLRLTAGERLLDIGCGWGALLCWAAMHYGVEAHGVTLSRNQFDYTRRRIAEAGLGGRVSVELKDYRDIDEAGRFDKIASVGMFEHVGLRNLPTYFSSAHRLLRDGGLFLNHGITHDREGWPDSVGTRFINRYVFPDGELDTVSNVQRAMERVGFEIWDVEGLRPHYALTLRHWGERLEARRREALGHVSPEVFRVWRLYMAACAHEFAQGGVGVYQILASKRAKAPPPVPLTRRDLYRERVAGDRGPNQPRGGS
ncbi:cyclopropane-fatty-acyl-phospholipid synthase family protein [Aromatoleum toluclasticum]|uniref:SAM-dependent methyltransferase n=1 Tax=Aromatoleum toluclasticum TaxID=92003 RepID=UPI001D18F9D1|nr:cyclopropane-fatty-acyl-phospholipid synthase family protein [Aromatoleum toluclasticum]MCC4114913.1 cyclopropane-fatty-acyl-phospholipid synthase family protein [Aromatoleum toluclasticum]